MIKIDFEKAKAITADRLRREREPLFAALDVQFQRNLETGASNDAVIREKQRLRNLPQLVDQCTTLEQLKALRG